MKGKIEKCKAYIFDLDGTLAYTIDDLRTAMNRMLEELGYPLMTKQDILNTINCGARLFVKRCLPEGIREDEEKLEEAFLLYQSCYQGCYLDSTVLYPGVAEGIAYLNEKNIPLAVFSNKSTEHVVPIINKLFPKDSFKIILGHDDRFPTKPDPSGPKWIAGQFDLNPNEIGFIGDSDVDMHTAINSGMHPIGVNWGYRPPELLLELGAEAILASLDDIKALA